MPDKDLSTRGTRRLIIWVSYVLYLLGALGVGLSLAALTRAGIGWDATFVTAAADAARAVDPSMDLITAYESIPNTNEFYGFLTNQLADLLHNSLPGTQGDLTPYNPDTYFWLGLVNILFSILGAASMAFAVTLATKSRLMGALAWAILLTIPLWVGVSHMNDRDLPVAVGLTMLSSGLVVSWSWRPQTPWVAIVVGSVIGSTGASIALATRAGIFLPLIALGGASLVIFAVYAIVKKSYRKLISATFVAGIAPLAAFGFTWLTDPVTRISPLRWLYDSYAYSRGEFPWSVSTRTAGIDIPMNDIPLWYVPAWLLAQLPILVSAAALLGCVFILLSAAQPRWVPRSLSRRTIVGISPFMVQGLVLPLAVIASGAQFYDGIRHLTFIFPAIAIAGAIGLSWLIPLHGDKRTLARVGVAISLSVLAVNLWAGIRWFPYDYAFINVVAGSNHPDRDWDLDYWGTSAREGVETLQGLGFTDIVVVPHGEPGRPYGAQNLFDPGSGLIDPKIFSPVQSQEFGYYWFHRFEYPLDDYDCTKIFTIERDGQILGEGGSCLTLPTP